jgi:hypothetical protein
MNAETLAAVTKFAASDLRTARNRGYILVAQTQKGLLALTYEQGEYTLSTTGVTSEVLARGLKLHVRDTLANLYSVVEG